ncbi:MAG: hypothetical protein IK145_07335 [Bacteroidales bacterium]|nr:hypothetical protein [Bacteroidales bacterium]
MPTRKEEIVARITEIERAIEAGKNEIEALTNELTQTPDALLERDLHAEADASIKRKNDFLKMQGLIPR